MNFVLHLQQSKVIRNISYGELSAVYVRHVKTNKMVELPESYDLRSLNIVQSETEHLERLVSDLLDLSRVQWGELDLHYSSFYLTDVLAERVRLAQVSAEQHTIFLDIQAQD